MHGRSFSGLIFRLGYSMVLVQVIRNLVQQPLRIIPSQTGIGDGFVSYTHLHKMAEVTLGKTGITVNKNGFGALPIQRIPVEQCREAGMGLSLIHIYQK